MTEPTTKNGRPALTRETAESVLLSSGDTTSVPLDGVTDLSALTDAERVLWLDGYGWGIKDGVPIGRAHLVADLLPAAEALAETKPSRSISYVELHRRRTTYATKAQTPAQIRAQASHSWRVAEREIAQRHEEAS